MVKKLRLKKAYGRFPYQDRGMSSDNELSCGVTCDAYQQYVYRPRHARKYAETITSLKTGEWAEALKIDVLSYGFRWLVNKKLSAVDTPDFVAWRDVRLKVVSA